MGLDELGGTLTCLEFFAQCHHKNAEGGNIVVFPVPSEEQGRLGKEF